MPFELTPVMNHCLNYRPVIDNVSSEGCHTYSLIISVDA